MYASIWEYFHTLILNLGLEFEQPGLDLGLELVCTWDLLILTLALLVLF